MNKPIASRVLAFGLLLLTTPARLPAQSTAPSLASLFPAQPAASLAAQTLTFAGSGFVNGFTLRLTSPTGVTQLSSQIQAFSPTSFQVSAVLSVAGQWSAVVS